MRVPTDFPLAFAGLEQLVERLLSGEGDGIGRESGRWMREDGLGSLALCKAAIFAMRHDAASGGLRENAGESLTAVSALDRVERAIDPGKEQGSPSPEKPRPARVPEALKERSPAARVFRLGKAQILAEPDPARGWHLSVSHPDRFPTIEELMRARGVTGETDATFAALLPPADAPADGRGFVVHLLEAAAVGSEGSDG